ncbi:nucleotide exchange factor GrpE [Buchnera aphidicola]|uniref:Protein GrpE n=1 Tax=Buchnera aphidicola subsp. Melaphis rhois TaxID=118103 RepID=A0A4D6YC49_BUCMH|nr:nucleotide exchange factor GrpE [Buchnera aphidicola]QCI23210.1 nucleotide exchange factor GrpE [Buchnera aphidicola (Melaphis rhois)]
MSNNNIKLDTTNDNENVTIQKNQTKNIPNQRDSFNNINQLNEKILNIKKNIVDIKLREQAEIENIKKRTDKKIKEIEKTQLQYFCTKLIPILDDLNNIKNIAHTLNIEHNKIVKGISLTLKSLLNTIKQCNIIVENKINIKFNPLLHQTESNEQLNDTDSYYVSSIIKDGYICQDTIIRKATVNIKKETL